MVEIDTVPTVGAVAVGALTIVMVGGRLGTVTANAVCGVGVIIAGSAPRAGVVAA